MRRIVVEPAIGHPRLRLNPPEPVGQRRDTSLAILAQMLFAGPADRDDPARAVGQAVSEDPLGIIDSGRMMAVGTVDKEGQVLFR